MSDLNDTMKSIVNAVDNVTVDDLKLDGVQVRIGGKLVNLEVVSQSNISYEEEIRDEYREKLNIKLSRIKEVVNEKFSSIMSSVECLKDDISRKERDLDSKLRNTKLMPDVTYDHACQGLSVVKSNSNSHDAMMWLVQGVYWPKYINHVPIEQSYQKRMVSSIIFVVETEGNKILRVSTRKPIGLEYFEHYHQSLPDCWGEWKPARNFEIPYDIIKVAREAEIVLENINTGSLANHNPRKLPRIETLKKHLDRDFDVNSVTVNNVSQRIGVDTLTVNEDDVWQY
jgi:hypothetical protein